MSIVVASVFVGGSDRNRGWPRNNIVSGELYVGGSDLWHFRRTADPQVTCRIRVERAEDQAGAIFLGVALCIDHHSDTELQKLADEVRAQSEIVASRELLTQFAGTADYGLAACMTALDSDHWVRGDLLTHIPWNVSIATAEPLRQETQWSR